MTVDGKRDEPAHGRSLPERMLGAVVGSVVSPVVDHVDVEDVVQRIDVDALLDRVDVNRILDRVDVNRILDRVDADVLLDRVDADRLLDRVDVNRVIARVDADALVALVDLDRVVERIDLDAVLARVDVSRLVERIDLDAVLARVDVNGLVERIDADALMARVDLDALLDRVDVNRLVERTELKAIIARSTTGVFTEVLDVARTQIIAVDQAAQYAGSWLLRRPRGEAPGTPSDPADRPDLRPLGRRQRAVTLQGHHAGSVSRFLAFIVDLFMIGLLFGLGYTLVSSAVEVVFGVTADVSQHRTLVTVTYLGWALSYLAVSWAAAGRTIGMALLGLLVVTADGGDLGPGRAVVRTLCFPLSFMVFGLGFVIGMFRRDRRQLHDLLAGTAVIYAWDAVEAQLRAEALSSAGATNGLVERGG